MDLCEPLQALIPGVQGRVLAVLAATAAESTGRTVAKLASSSPAQTNRTLNRLVDLGVVERRDVPPAALYRLSETNLVGRAILELDQIRYRLIEHMADTANAIDPAPISVAIYGSLARCEADADSDIDVLVVRPAGVDQHSDPWEATLWHWARQVEAAAGNRVELLELAEEDAPGILRFRKSLVWRDIVDQAQHVAGRPLAEIYG